MTARARQRIGLGMLPHPDGPHVTSGYGSYTKRLLEYFAEDPDIELVPLLEPASRWGPSSPHGVVRALHRRIASSALLRRGASPVHAMAAGSIEYTAPHLGGFSPEGEASIEWFSRAARTARVDACHFLLTGALGTVPYEACDRLGLPYVVTVVDYGPICGQGLLRQREERICSGPETTLKCAECLAAIGRPEPEARIGRRTAAYAHYYGRARAVITFTQAHADMLERWLGLPPGVSLVTPFAVPHPAPGFAKESDAFKHPLRFAFVARTCPEWGVQQLLDAWRAAGVPPSEAVLEIHTDDGFQRAGYDEAYADLVSAGSVTVATERMADRLDELHARTAAAVVPSLWRNTGSSSGLEALVRDTPVVTNDEYGMYEDLPAPMRSIAFPTGDTAALASRLRELVRSPDRLEAMSAVPFDRTFEDHVAPLRDHYRSMLHG